MLKNDDVVELTFTTNSKNVDQLYRDICNHMENVIRPNGKSGMELSYVSLSRADYDTLAWGLANMAKYGLESEYSEKVFWDTNQVELKCSFKITLKKEDA